MGQMFAGYDLMPESTEIDLDRVIALLPGIMPEGVEVIEVDMSEIRKGRGAIHCMTAFLAREW